MYEFFINHTIEQEMIVFILCMIGPTEVVYIEQITHSLCSLEFKPHRELYDWFWIPYPWRPFVQTKGICQAESFLHSYE